MAASLHGHNQLINGHWRLIQPLGTPPFFSLEVGGQGGQDLKVPPGIMGLVPMATSPQLKGFPKVTAVKPTQMELKEVC